jgi:hypothetical protein
MSINKTEATVLLGAFLEEIVRNKHLIEMVEKIECPLEKVKALSEIATEYLEINWDSFMEMVEIGAFKLSQPSVSKFIKTVGDC